MGESGGKEELTLLSLFDIQKIVSIQPPLLSPEEGGIFLKKKKTYTS